MASNAAQGESSASRFRLPGFGLPLNFTPRLKDGDGRVLFRNALDGKDLLDGVAQLPLTTLREFTMLQFMNYITDKPEWHRKVFDETITSKWKAEALSEDDPDMDMTEKMVDWCIAEVQYKAELFEKTGFVTVYNGDVVKSDSAIPDTLKEALRAATALLEQVPDREKDWHPNSDDKVLDLVHPSLFPLVYGRSRILSDSTVGLDDCVKRSGEGVTIPVPPKDETSPEGEQKNLRWRRTFTTPYSRKFQWLPCDVALSPQDRRAKITSYINSLHPEVHKDLYKVIEEIITRTIPLWNATLTPLKDGSFPYHRIKYTECVYDPDPESWDDSEKPQQEDDEDEDDYFERLTEWYEETRVVVKPEPESFAPPPDLDDAAKVDIWRDYADRGLQVIVKLATIHLTPDKPTYEGGSWHVEGQLNEHICASAIFYYSNENITTSRLAFRQQSRVYNHDISYAQDHHDWLDDVFGCQQDEPGVQDVGSVDTREGRLLTWPNTLQHRVQPFELEDRTKPGHRKILALFLVDPNIRVISTANVPCQRRDWWSALIRRGQSAVAKRLPVELQDKIFEEVEDFPIGMEEAKEIRVQLMNERKRFVYMHDEAFRQHEFSLCEH
ncbi:putative protein of unknown function (DUF4246) [Lyophyllum shimeji]|uniref:Uncharacterized protein n=1 Tax=Lyophyllum shimeji TaxID=47721 RepID=A0A9P3PHE6_LYOSH|nr:putative protein of unknown function (DUF4246) [Lyophyllum shimeji]